ncbi:MAG: hypothetical protein ACR2LN_05070 [Candidatus Levyibacteriota bacterium]
MDLQNHLKNELETSAQYELTDEDNKLLVNDKRENYIFKKLSSKKFRKWSLDESSEKQIKNAIHLNVSANNPIQFIFPFGGYKLWSLPTAPQIDWAEFFMISYYLRWIAPLLPVYQPGVQFIFSSDDVIVEKLDNIPPKDTNAYFASFQKLLQQFSGYFPQNLSMEIKRVGDLFTPNEFEEELAENIIAMKKVYEHPDPVNYQKMLTTSKLNFQWNGVEDFSQLSDAEKEQKIKMGPIFHDAYGKLNKRRAFVRGEDKIVVFTTPISNAIAIGTTKSSITKFWTGYGVVEKRGEAFIDRILSPEQFQRMQKTTYETQAVNLIDLPNFKTITITPPLNFTNS